MKSYRRNRSSSASGAKITSRFTLDGLQSLGVALAKRCNNLFRWNAAARIGLHSVINWDNLLSEPPFDSGITLLQRSQASPDDLACRSVCAGSNERVDVTRLLGR